jgi:hypothetical protein
MAITEERRKKFKIGSDFAKQIAKSTYLSVRIKNVIFVHGGFCEEFLRQMKKTNGFDGLIDLNNEIIPQLNDITRKYLSDEFSTSEKDTVERYIYGKNSDDVGSKYGPLWCRDHSMNNLCGLDKISKKLNIEDFDHKSMVFVIAHTPQFYTGINSACNGNVWRIDVGMSKAFEEYPGSIALLNVDDILLNKDTRAMSIISINNETKQDTFDKNNDFKVVSKGVLCKDFTRNELAILRDRIKTLQMYTEYYKNNRTELKKVIPTLRTAIQEFLQISKI